MAIDLVVLGAAVLGLIGAGLGSVVILNVIGDFTAFIAATFFAAPAAILTLLSALGISVMV